MGLKLPYPSYIKYKRKAGYDKINKSKKKDI